MIGSNKFFSFILAFICFTFPYTAPRICYLGIFLFPSFLFLLLRNQSSKILLIAWSFAVAIVHLLPLCDALITMASGPLFLRLIPPFVLVLYIGGFIALWLLITRYIMNYCSRLLTKIAVWTICLWFYFLIMDQMILWPFGQYEGYLFMNPFIILCTQPSLVTFIQIIPFWLALLWFCITSSCITLFFVYQTKYYLLLLSIVIIIWTYQNISLSEPPSWLKTIGHLTMMLPDTIDAQMGSMLIEYELDHLYAANSAITTVIMPESSWNGTALTNINYLAAFDHAIAHIIMGSFADQPHTNRLYYFKNGFLAYYHDKQHAVPVTERPIAWLNTINNILFFQKSPPIYPCKTQRFPLQLPSIGPCFAYICSELFCNNWPDDDQLSIPIIALINDWWFSIPHFRHLMALAARFQAIKWERPILYISFYYAQYFDKYGNSAPIATPAVCFV